VAYDPQNRHTVRATLYLYARRRLHEVAGWRSSDKSAWRITYSFFEKNVCGCTSMILPWINIGQANAQVLLKKLCHRDNHLRQWHQLPCILFPFF
jgi:hypothetical protein